MSKLSTKSYKGVRDFYPDDQFIQNYIFSTWRDVAESFGYQEYAASPLEPTDLYRAKTGQEIVEEQTYSFRDRGDRDVTLRPEMTPTVARLVAGRRRELNFPLRWYSIPNLFRYERPQRGRLREHFQLNVDLFGIDSIYAEAEVIQMSAKILENFGLDVGNFEIKINDRELVEQKMDELALDEETSYQLQKLMDKKGKIDDFDAQVEKLMGEPLDFSLEPGKKIVQLTEILDSVGIKNVVFDPYLMRGFDYYTGIIFEVFDIHPENNRSLFGGGRFDHLLEIFDARPVPTVGFGMGDVTIRDTLETYNLLPEVTPSTQICLVPFSGDEFNSVTSLANYLREANLNIFVDYSGDSVGDQISTADAKNIPYVIVVGPDEVESGSFVVKHMKTGKQSEPMQMDILASYLNHLGE